MVSVKDVGFNGSDEFELDLPALAKQSSDIHLPVKQDSQRSPGTSKVVKSITRDSRPSRNSHDKPYTSTSRLDDQKTPSESSSSSDCDLSNGLTVKEIENKHSEEVVWLYLTYDTILPHTTELNKNTKDNTDVGLRVPDLSPYQNPLDWSKRRKSGLIWLSCISTCFTAYAAGCYAAGIELIAAEWNLSIVAAYVGVTVFTAGFGVAPMILAPFSELNGRRPLFLITGFLFLVFTICCAFTRIFAGMLVSRFLAGCASSTFSTMVGGVVSDIYIAQDRNTPMALFTAAALFGTGLGPMISGFLVEQLGSWRWIFYLHSIILAVLVVLLFIFFKETRGPVLLSKKAKKLNHWYEQREKSGHLGFEMPIEGSDRKRFQRIRWKVKADEERATIPQMLKISLIRPFHLLFTEPVVFFFSLWISFAWSILYCTFSVVPYMFQTVYRFSLQEATAVFSAISVASVITTLFSIAQDKWQRRGLTDALPPERRLIFPCIGSIALPVALFLFGWTSNSSIHWIVPTIAIGFATVGIFSIYLAVFNYLADTYHRYASSAIAAQSFCRNLMGGTFPLFTEQMFSRLGFGPCGSMLGGIGALLTIVPYVLLFYGPKIRAKSKFASEILGDS